MRVKSRRRKRNRFLFPILWMILLILVLVLFLYLRQEKPEIADGSAAVLTEETGKTLAIDQDTESEAGTSGEAGNILHFVDAHGQWYDTEIRDDIAKNTYDWSKLSRSGNDITYEGDPNYHIEKGVDVSHYQGDIDWEKVKAAGWDFAILRMAYRGYGQEGKLCLDSKIFDNLEGAQKAGIRTGVYVFSQAVNEEEAEEEADIVIENLKDYTLDLPVVFDPEIIYQNDEARTSQVSGEQFTANAIAFCDKIAQAGYQPMIYSNMYWEAFLFDLGKLADYPIWYADYEDVPQTPYAFEYWQYTEKGAVDGIDGSVDLDVRFCGN